MKKNRSIIYSIVTQIIILLITISCSYDKTELTLGSAFDSTWQFNSSSNYDFDDNLVQFQSGKVSLKALDLQNSGEDFTAGNHAGTCTYLNNIQLNSVDCSLAGPNLKDVTNILPSEVSNMKGYWRFDGNLLDSVGTNHGTNVNNAVLASDSNRDQSFVNFQTAIDYVDLGNSPSLMFGSGEFSFSFWFKAPNSNPFQASNKIITFGDDNSGGKRVQFILQHTTGFFDFVVDDNVTKITVRSNRTFNDNVWHHVVATRNNSLNQLRVFLDGEEVSVGPVDSTTLGSLNSDAGNGALVAGTYSAVDNQVNNTGTVAIDELAVWDVAITEKQAKHIFEQQVNFKADETQLSSLWTPKFESLIGYWRMDGNWQDSSGNSNHATNVNAATYSANSQVGSLSGEFPNHNDSLNITQNSKFDITDNLSIAGWIYMESESLSYARHIISKYNGVSDNNFALYFFGTHAGANPNNAGNLALYGSKTGVHELITPTYQVTPGRWQHFVVTYDSAVGGSTYIDGTLYGFSANTGSLTPNIVDVSINLSSGGVGEINAKLDDIAIWDATLSASDVSTIYHRQKQKYSSHFDSEVLDLGSASSAWPDLSWSTNLPFGKELVGDFDIDGAPDSENSTDYPIISGDLSNGLIGHWSFSETALNTAPDLGSGATDYRDGSGNNNHAIEVSGVESNNGKIGRGLLLDGVADQVQVDSIITDLQGFNTGTLSIWFKTSNQGVQGLYAFADSSTSLNLSQVFIGPGTSSFPDESIGFTFVRDGTQLLHMFVRKGHEHYLDGRWHHAVVRIDGIDNAIFMDGKKEAVDFAFGSATTSEFSNINNGDAVNFGSRRILGTSNLFFDGSLDEHAIWNRPLTDSEIQQLYRRGANRIKLQVKSCVDASCNCKSYNVAPAGSETDCDGDGILNEADNDDIHKAEFIGPGGDGTTYYSELYNRTPSDITFNCALNTTDSDPGVCVKDEITLGSSPKPTGPEFLNIDYTQFVTPSANRYAQYRVYMEADENTACNGEPCLPELTSVTLNPSNEVKYASEYVEIKPKSPIYFTTIRDAKITADSCASFRIHRDPNSYYHDGTSWVLVSNESHRNIASEITSNIQQFATQFGAGELEVISYIKSNPAQTDQCSIDEIDINFN